MMGRQQQANRRSCSTRSNWLRHVPSDHLLRQIDAILESQSASPGDPAMLLRRPAGPWVDSGLMIHILLIGYAFGTR